MSRLTRELERAINRTLRPFGLEIRRHSAPERRADLRATLAYLASTGFKPATVVDVGVAQGTPALYEVFPDAHHLLVEPLEEFRPHLERITHGLEKASYVLVAAGDRAGTVVLNLGAALEVTSRHEIVHRSLASGRQRTVPCVPLDDVWGSHALAGPALLKVDAEGAEIDVLRGAKTVLQACEYVVLEVAIGALYDGGARAEEVVRCMAERGFVLADIAGLAYSPRGFLQVADLAFVPIDGWVRRHQRGAAQS